MLEIYYIWIEPSSGSVDLNNFELYNRRDTVLKLIPKRWVQRRLYIDIHLLSGFRNTLQDVLRDRLVCGINDGHIQRRLLSEANMTYKKVLDISQAVESAERNANDLQGKR